MAQQPIGIVFVSDNRLQHQGLSLLIHTHSDFHVQLASADIEEALDHVRDGQPSIVLLDLALEDEDCLTIAATVRREVPNTRVIIMGLTAAQPDIADMVRAGVSGFVMRDESLEGLLRTVRVVAAGGQVLPPALTRNLFDDLNRPKERAATTRSAESSKLTNREREVMQLLAEGLSNKSIAARLNIAVHTVKTHVHNVLEKLALSSRLEIAAFSHAMRESPTGQTAGSVRG
jgi:DNA-binding NarL/FixJ family response regulator